MSYGIINNGMGFLNKLVEVFEVLEKENIYLEVDAYDIPRSTDRHPYHEENEVEEFSFIFTYMGKNFEVKSEYKSEFAIKVELFSDEKEFHHEEIFTTKEKKSTIKKMWQELLTKLETALDLKPSSRHFFDIWYGWQNIGISYYDEKKKEAFINHLYQEITRFIDPGEIEKALENRYRNARNTSDLSIRDRISQLTKVEFHQFLNGRLYIIYSNGELFVFENENEALKKYEEEHVRRIKELVDDEVKNLKRIKSF